MNRSLLLSCEHGGNRVPATFRPLFQDATQVLASHRGWDAGSLTLAKTFQRTLVAPLFYSTVSRLVVELNRSLHHRHLFSEFTGRLEDHHKNRILNRYYHPYRSQIEAWIEDQLRHGSRVVHLSLHTFTPVWNGQDRDVDVGLLYDPERAAEVALCDRWRASLRQMGPDLRIRRNFPYRGNADGLTTYLRRRLGPRYLGIELEVNQIWPAKSLPHWRRLQQQLVHSFATACEH